MSSGAALVFGALCVFIGYRLAREVDRARMRASMARLDKWLAERAAERETS
jgi:hypothetical protein